MYALYIHIHIMKAVPGTIQGAHIVHIVRRTIGVMIMLFFSCHSMYLIDMVIILSI